MAEPQSEDGPGVLSHATDGVDSGVGGIVRPIADGHGVAFVEGRRVAGSV